MRTPARLRAAARAGRCTQVVQWDAVCADSINILCGFNQYVRLRDEYGQSARGLSYHDKGSAQLDHLLEPSKDWPESTMMIREGEEVDRVLLHRLIRKYLSFGCLQKLCRIIKGFVHPH